VSEMAPEPVLVWTVRCVTEPDTWHNTQAEADRQVCALGKQVPPKAGFAYPVLVHPYPPDLEATA
jgi:hypothetical protein